MLFIYSCSVCGQEFCSALGSILRYSKMLSTHNDSVCVKINIYLFWMLKCCWANMIRVCHQQYHIHPLALFNNIKLSQREYLQFNQTNAILTHVKRCDTYPMNNLIAAVINRIILFAIFGILIKFFSYYLIIFRQIIAIIKWQLISLHFIALCLFCFQCSIGYLEST